MVYLGLLEQALLPLPPPSSLLLPPPHGLPRPARAGFVPFYVDRQPNAEYLKVQEGALSLYNKYEAGFGNLYRR